MKSLIVAVFVLATPALAQSVGERSANLQGRINQGVATGQLNAAEANRLNRQQDRLQRTIARDRADGPGLTVHERAKIQRQENRLSRHVYAQKHDRQAR